MNRVMNIVYNWVKRKISSDGRFPQTENTRNSQDIENMAKKEILMLKLANFTLITLINLHVLPQIAEYTCININVRGNLQYWNKL